MSETNNSAPADINSSDSSVESQSTESQTDQNQEITQQVEPPKPSKRKFTYKADGEDVSEELDDTEISKRLSLSKAAHKRMNEAHKLQVQAQNLIKEFNENPTALFKKLDSKKARSAAEQFIMEQIEQELMSPEERDRQDKMRRLQQYEENEKKQKDEQEAQQMAQLESKYVQDYDKTITEALVKSGLPKVPSTIKRMAALMSKNLDLGLDLSPADLVDEVKKSYFAEFKELFGSGDVSLILEMFGDDVSNKIRKHDLQKLKTFAGSKNEPVNTSKQATPSKGYLSPDEWRAQLDKKLKE